jgi:hypothetical protein
MLGLVEVDTKASSKLTARRSRPAAPRPSRPPRGAARPRHASESGPLTRSPPPRPLLPRQLQRVGLGQRADLAAVHLETLVAGDDLARNRSNTESYLSRWMSVLIWARSFTAASSMSASSSRAPERSAAALAESRRSLRVRTSDLRSLRVSARAQGLGAARAAPRSRPRCPGRARRGRAWTPSLRSGRT